MRWALAIYIQRTKYIRNSPGLFLVIAAQAWGEVLSSQRISKTISGCILLYQLAHLPLPHGVSTYSTRVQTASVASLQEVLLLDISKAATWSASHTFTRQCALIYASSADAFFGTVVLQAVIPPASSHPPPLWVLLVSHPQRNTHRD